MFEKTIKDEVLNKLYGLKGGDTLRGEVLVYDKDDDNSIKLTIREAAILFFPMGLLSGILVSVIVYILLRLIFS